VVTPPRLSLVPRSASSLPRGSSLGQLVPRMFDLERQLLCFVLHESLFLPALQASLYHLAPRPSADGTACDPLSGPGSPRVGGGTPRKMLRQGAAVSGVARGGVPAPSEASQLPPVETAAAATTGGGKGGSAGEGQASTRGAEEPSGGATAVGTGGTAGGAGTGHGSGGGGGDDGGEVVSDVDDATAEGAAAWPQHGTWFAPFEGGRRGAGGVSGG